MNKTHQTTSTTSSAQKRTWSSPVLINLTLVDTAAGKSPTPSEGCKTAGGTLQCKAAWDASFGPS